jgi:multidrug efflux pump subunit AcrA (membrane-fusion protein)
VRVPIGFPHQALLVSDRAIDNDQGQKIVYVVNEKKEVVQRSVRLGQLHEGLREITSGLESGEQVVVRGIQQVRAGLIVEPKVGDMPTSENRDPMPTTRIVRLSARP